MTDEQNSAEREAEQILMDAAQLIQAEECPQGSKCAVHHRVEDAYENESLGYARYITYSGDYCVITEDNYKASEPVTLLRVALGLMKPLPRWETTIFFVGSGTLGNLAMKSNQERQSALRYMHKHDDWNALRGIHETTVSGLMSGLIDVSKPIEEA